MSTASITIAGRLGRDPEQRNTNSGTAITRFSVAVDTGWGDNKITTWWNVAIFGRSGEAAAQHLRKGSWVFVSGVPSVREYQKKDGGMGWSAEVAANDWGFVGNKGDGQGQSSNQSQPRQQSQQQSQGGGSMPYTDDSIPFAPVHDID